MKNLTLTLLCLLLPAVAGHTSAQTVKSSYDTNAKEAPPVRYPAATMAELAAVRDAALSDDYAWHELAHLTENIGPRPTGSAQAEAAAQYVAAEMRKLGLEVRLEETRVPRWIRRAETAELVEYPGQVPGTTQKVLLTALGGNVPTPADGITAEVVVASSFDELKAMGRERVAGKIVLWNVPFDTRKAAAGESGSAYGEAVAYRGNGAKRAAELGAVASLVRSVGGADFRIPHTGYSQPAGIASGAVTAEDAETIAHLAAQGAVRMHLVLLSQNEGDVVSHNVVADLKGSEHPEQVVIVSGHLDSWDLGTGAIDDAAGVVVAMEAAEIVQRLHLHPRRTLRVIAWMDEENGGRGHDDYAVAHKNEFADHVAAIESDLGAEHPLGFNAKATAAALALLAPVQEVLRPIGANLMRPTPNSPGADISPLGNAGVPTFGVWQNGLTYFNYHHTAADTLDKVDPKELQENAAAMAVLGYALVAIPEALPR